MPEIQSSESQESDRLSSILAGYLTPKELARRVRSYRTNDRALASSPSGTATCNNRPKGLLPPGVCERVAHGVRKTRTEGARDPRFARAAAAFNQASRLSGITSPRLRDLAAATIEAKRSVA